MPTSPNAIPDSPTDDLLTEADLQVEQGLSAMEVDRKLRTLAKTHRRLESSLRFYLREVDERCLYEKYGYASTVDYARERLGRPWNVWRERP